MTPRTLGDVEEPVPPKPNLVYKRHFPMPENLKLNDSTKKKINTLLLKRQTSAAAVTNITKNSSGVTTTALTQ